MRGDPDSILSHYAQDIVLSYPGIPDQDYATLAKGYGELRSRPAHVTANTRPTFDEILVNGDLAIVRVRWTTTISVAARDTLPAREATRYLRDLQVWRREPAGEWRFIRGMHYPDSTAAPR
jgi:ketosteroid isomerase-like protein